MGAIGFGSSDGITSTVSVAGVPGNHSVFPALHNPRTVTEDPRIRGLADPQQVVAPADVDTGLREEHPKEPTAHYHDGTVYLVCVSWNDADGTVTTDKRPALFVSDRPDGGFEQVSLLADTPGTYEHAAAVTVRDGRLYVFYSVREDIEAGGNDIHLKHAPVADVPAEPGGWADEGAVLRNARDPGLFRVDDRWYVFFSSEGWRAEDGVERVGEYDNVGRVEGEDLLRWENRADPVYAEANDQAPDVVPKADGSGYWLVVTEYTDGKDAYAVAGEADRIDGEFSGRVPLCRPGDIGGSEEPWFASMTTHFDYCKRDACGALYAREGRIPAYFEARGDGPYSVGVVFAPAGTRPDE